MLFYVHSASQNFTAVLMKTTSDLKVLLAWFQQDFFFFFRNCWHLSLNACPLNTEKPCLWRKHGAVNIKKPLEEQDVTR